MVLVASILLLTTTAIRAQEAIPVGGGDATGDGGSLSYTVGQVVYTSNTGATGSVMQGVQQSYKISTIGIEIEEINLELIAYPNPTKNTLTLNIDNYNSEKLSYHLYDMQGKLLDSKQVVNNSTTIDMQDLPVSSYILNVFNENSLKKTFQIIKN